MGGKVEGQKNTKDAIEKKTCKDGCGLSVHMTSFDHRNIFQKDTGGAVWEGKQSVATPEDELHFLCFFFCIN